MSSDQIAIEFRKWRVRKRRRRILVGTFAFVCAALLFHYGYYPDEGDPKNIKYVLWKHGLYKLNLDLATEVMVGDPDHESLVIGKTEAQLKKRFGYLLTPDQASYYLRACTTYPPPPGYQADPPYERPPWQDKKRLFIRQSPWMVVFDGDKASELVLIKGC